MASLLSCVKVWHQQYAEHVDREYTDIHLLLVNDEDKKPLALTDEGFRKKLFVIPFDLNP